MPQLDTLYVALRGRRLARASGVVYIGLGVGAALGNSRAKA